MNTVSNWIARVAVLLACAVSGCVIAPKEVPGCMDPSALNYNAGATWDDGSCEYLNDLWAGSYTVSDTVWYVDRLSGDTVSGNSVCVALVTSIVSGHLLVEGLGCTNCSLDCIVTTSSMSLAPGPQHCNARTMQCSRVGDVLRYSIVLGSSDEEHHRGAAVKD